jgi:hypothetical protein
MIELRYNDDGKLEYRTAITIGQYRGLYANFDAGGLRWDEWKIVPSVEKEVVTPTDNNLRTERVTAHKWDEALAILHEGGSFGRGNDFHPGTVAALMIWADKEIASLTAERDSFEHLFHSVNDSANEKYDDDLDRARRDVHQANIECDRLRHLLNIKESECETHHPWVHPVEAISATKKEMNKVIEELKKEKAEDWKAACESARIASGTVYDLKKDKDEWIKAFKILAKIIPGIPVDEDDPVGTAAKIDEAIRRQMTNMSTLIESYARDNRRLYDMTEELQNSSTSTITKEDIDQLSCIADRLDYAQFYESANSLRSFIARNK